MLIGIDASAALSPRLTGVGSYVANMTAGLNRLSAVEPDLDVIYFSNRYESESPSVHGDAPLASFYRQQGFPSRTIWTQWGLAQSIEQVRPDLCHFPNYLAPLVRTIDVPYVVTMYDMSVFRCPQYQPLKTVLVHRSLTPKIARRAACIVTISESARADIVDYLGVSMDRVRVVHGGVSRHFEEAMRHGWSEAHPLSARYTFDFPYILSVGTLEPRKNHANLVDAFSLLCSQERIPHHLVLAGAPGWKDHPLYARAQKSHVADRIHFLGFVPDADLAALYRRAEAFAFPSFYEGFGLPVLEAFTCGVPALISNDPALMEVAGPGTSVVVEPHSVDSIAGGLHHLLSDRVFAARLRERAYARVRDFSWDRCATETLDLYRQLLGTELPMRSASTAR